MYSKVSNRRGVWNSRGGWKKYQKLIVGGGGGGEKTENFNNRGGGWLFLNCFFFPFLTMKTTVIKNFFVFSKSKIKTKVISKQNLEHFKMINRKLFIHKFCNSSKKCCCRAPG